MKFALYMIILSIFHFNCIEENSAGGVKFIITDNILNLLLPKFKEEILKSINTKVSLPNYDKMENLEIVYSNFSLDKFKANFNEKGQLNLKFNNISANLIGKMTFERIIYNRFNFSLYDLCLELNITINSHCLDSGEYIPFFESDTLPKINFNYKIKENDTGDQYIKSLIENKNFEKNFIFPSIININNDMLNKIVIKFPKELEYGNGGFIIDLSMVGPIEYGNKFIQINSLGFFYHKNYKITHNRTKFPLSNFPSINNISHNLYLSSYALSSSLFTQASFSHQTTIKFYPNVIQLEYMLPKIRQKIGNQAYTIIFNGNPENLKFELFEGFMNVTIPGTFNVNPISSTTPVFSCEVELIMKTELVILSYNSMISGNITDVDFNLLNITKNDINNDTIFERNIQYNFRYIKPKFIDEANNFIRSNYFLSIPPMMNIQFKNIKFEHKYQYVIMNFNLAKY